MKIFPSPFILPQTLNAILATGAIYPHHIYITLTHTKPTNCEFVDGTIRSAEIFLSSFALKTYVGMTCMRLIKPLAHITATNNPILYRKFL